eukprot:TRINITY_DN6920_c0_g1_i5.p1 TRINITY_DN6920_c0_g1~~TRINITY_DN6920_c0_g1_i5.p1  ORF type:complete len:254 (-),score=46.16 TRINITY_DN6920_c0_g1_i5:150-911(-)
MKRNTQTVPKHPPGPNSRVGPSLESLCESLKSNSKDVITLHLEVTPNPLEKPSHQIQQFQHLHLSWNTLGLHGAKCILDALASNSTLTSLNMEANNIEDAGTISIGEVLKLNNTLKHLNLAKNGIGDAGAHSIFEALKSNSGLISLNMNSNGMGDKSANSICGSLQYNSTLTSLDIGDNQIGDAGAFLISEALKSNSTLTNLSMEGLIISYENWLSITTKTHSNEIGTLLLNSSNSFRLQTKFLAKNASSIFP